jgi:hypothetical protein
MLPFPDRNRQYQPAPLGELVEHRPGHLGGRGCDYDRIIRAPLRPALIPSPRLFAFRLKSELPTPPPREKSTLSVLPETCG